MGFETKEDTLERTIQCCKQWKMKYSELPTTLKGSGFKA